MPIFKGTIKAETAYKGSTQLARIYKGSTLVYESYKTSEATGIPPITLSNSKAGKMLGYKIYGNSVQNKLPEGYTLLQWIENTGTEYIDLNFIPNQNTRVVMDFQIAESSGTGFALFGSRISTTSRGYTFQKISNGWWGGMYGNTLVNAGTTQYDTNRHTVDKNKNIVYLDGNTIMSFDAATFTCNGNMLLFAMDNNGTPAIAPEVIKVYSFKAYDNGTLIRNLVPCKNTSNVVGMYDTVNNVFYANQGTGAFTGGTEINLPKGYTRISYIEADGNQYLDTGIVPDADTQVDYKVRFLQGALEASPLIGARVGSAGTNRFFPISYSNPSSSYRISFGNALLSDTIDFDIDYEGSFQPQNEVAVLNGVSYSLSGNSFTKTTNNNLFLFATSGYGDNLYQSKGRIYYCKITKNNSLLRYFIPCINKQGVVGMYDLVSEDFFSSETATGFIAGEETPNPNDKVEIRSVGENETSLPVGYTQLDYIQSTGEQYINTGYVPNANTRIKAVVAFTEDTGSIQQFGAIANIGTSNNAKYARWHFGVYSSKLTSFRESSTQAGDIRIDYDNSFHTYETFNDGCSLDDTTVTAENHDNSNITYTLFARNGYTTAGGTASISAYTKAKLKSFEIYENDVLIRNFVPCISNTNAVGVYDTINGVFYANQGTGNFIAGNEIAKGGYKIPVKVGTEFLPEGYTQLKYIESNGTQYIDTNLKLSNKTKIEITYEPTSNGWFFGYKTQISGSGYAGSLTTTSTAAFDYFGDRQTASDFGTGKATFLFDENKIYINGVLIATHPTVTTQQTDGNCYLMQVNVSGTTVTQGQGKLYGAKIYDDSGVLVRNFVPCINNQNEIGLYDNVNGIFYSNQGTGTFTAGEQVSTITNIYLSEPLRKIGNADVIKLPSGYTQLEYIESTGTQYIDTGITATNNMGMKIKYSYTASGSAAISGIFKSAAPRQDVFFISSNNGQTDSNVFCAHRGATITTTINIETNTDYTCEINYLNSGKIYFNNNFLVNVGSSSIYNATIPIFARYSVGSSGYSMSSSRIYYVEFTEGTEISHKLIPARNSSNVVGMYDVITGTFYTNVGTGDFIAGSPIYADYIDFKNQKVYRQVGQHSLVGYTFSQTASADYGDYFGNTQAPTDLNIKTSVDSTDTNKYVFANFAKGVSVADRTNVTNTVRVYMTTTAFVVRNSINQEFVNATALQTFLNDKGNYIMYVLATPTEESVTLPAILLNEGVNVISVGTDPQPSNMWIKYKYKEE